MKTLKLLPLYESPEISILQLSPSHPLLDLSGTGNEKFGTSSNNYDDDYFD